MYCHYHIVISIINTSESNYMCVHLRACAGVCVEPCRLILKECSRMTLLLLVLQIINTETNQGFRVGFLWWWQ